MIITDDRIQDFINEKKILSKDFHPVFKDKLGHKVFEKEVLGEEGNTYKIIIRQSKINPLDFSVIFGIVIEGQIFRIRRYNGDSHDHTNKIEEELIEGFHIHKATQRYQERGFREEGFAEKSTRYSDWSTALKVMLRENNFQLEVPKDQTRVIKWNKTQF